MLMFISFVQVESHKKAAAATANGKFKDEIIPVTTKVKLIQSLLMLLLSIFLSKQRLRKIS